MEQDNLTCTCFEELLVFFLFSDRRGSILRSEPVKFLSDRPHLKANQTDSLFMTHSQSWRTFNSAAASLTCISYKSLDNTTRLNYFTQILHNSHLWKPDTLTLLLVFSCDKAFTYFIILIKVSNHNKL